MERNHREGEKWVFDDVVEHYIRNKENLNWLRNENPYAIEELPRRLLKAESRGLWQADPELLEEVCNAAFSVEGDMEEAMGEVKEEFQGNKVEAMTATDVEKWEPEWQLPQP
ncbi:MAG: hypothetical protein B1H11_12045 [Desulfobacteraceae bacterium 4484_190.1]|nr:MAG: hypothetical protein B1H11_12045 [Desulfobacteraceae bacterium 4484_190.1]